MDRIKKIVVLFLGTKGAGPAYAFEMTKALSQKTKVLAIVSNYAENIESWRIEARHNDNLEISSYNTYRSIPEFVISLFNFRLFKRIAQFITTSNANAIYIPMGHFWNRFILKGINKITVYKTIHDVILHNGEDGLLYKLSEKIFGYKGDGYVVLDEKYVPILAKRVHISNNKICVIPHASFRSYGFSSNVDETRYNKILFFGRIIKYKGIDILLDAFKKIDGLPLRLKIAGNGDFTPYMNKAKSIKNIELNIGWIKDEDIHNLFKDVDLVVLPYISASQSGVIPLAYSFGKPVIATDIGALSSQVIDGKTGYIVPVNDVDALKDAIIKSYSSEENLVKMKREALLYANENSWEKSSEKLLEFIEKDSN